MSEHCYYCDQIFDSKEKLFDHLEVHSETIEKQENSSKRKSHNTSNNSGN